MALVAYDSNSDSEYEEEAQSDSLCNGTVTLTKSLLPSDSNIAPQNEERSLFSTLPPPQEVEHEVIEEVEDEFLHKKEEVIEKPRKRIRIDIPTLNYSSDEDEKPVERKFKQKVSGLFTLLPPPKGTPLSSTSFVPNVLQKRNSKKTPPSKTQQKRKAAKDETPKPTPISIIKNGSDSTDDEEFEIPETYDDATWQEVCGRKKKKLQKPPPEPEPEQVKDMETVEAAPDVDQPYKGLDNKAFKELLGNTKRIPRNIKLIDVHEDTIRPDKEVWLRSLTDPDLEAEPVIEATVDSTRKVKNHITALAQKALANDKELQKTWSENRYNRKQTQAKYGF